MNLTQYLENHENFAMIAKGDQVTIQSGETLTLETNTLEELEELQKSSNAKINFILPFASAQREGVGETHGEDPILAFRVDFEKEFTRDKVAKYLPQRENIQVSDVTTNMSDTEYKEKVLLMQEEIRKGNICQGVLARYFETQLQNNSTQEHLAIYEKLLQIPGGYMTYFAQYGDKIFTGASPEVHLSISDNMVHKAPLAGTMDKFAPGDFGENLLDFIQDKKERNELSMITDEELKMLTKICKTGTITGPTIKNMLNVCHGQFKFYGELKPSISLLMALKETLFSPTIVGSPIESAFAIIKKFETDSRKYYGSAFGVVGDDFLDTTIPIRSAQIDAQTGKIEVYAGAGITLGSDPQKEADETRKKSFGLLGALKNSDLKKANRKVHLSEEDNRLVGANLNRERGELSEYLLNRQTGSNTVEKLVGKKVYIIHSGDDFTAMIENQINDMGASAEIIRNTGAPISVPECDIVVLGPGYGDINDGHNPKMQALMELTTTLLEQKKPVVGICLGHQAICKALGGDIQKQKTITQGIQKEIELNGKTQKVGMYNTFAPNSESVPTPGEKTEDQDGNLLHLKQKNISSSQFHPESIMTKDGFNILANMLTDAL